MEATLFYPNKKKVPEISTIRVTKEAFQKMNLYASIVSEIIGGDKECLGTLLNYKDRKDNTVRDIHLWKGQVITSSDGWPGDPMDDYVEAKNRGMEILGLWHSHGSNGVFHSSYDQNVLNQMYGRIKNKIVTDEKNKSIESIVDGEVIRLFEDGSNKEIRIKGKIEDLKYVERDECRVLNSIVINKNSYSGGYNNPKLNHDYDGEVWAGYEKNDYKRLRNIRLELLEESNNIQLDKEELVKEVGEKVIFQGNYLKDLPDYQKVLENYRKSKDIQEVIEPIKQDIPDEITEERKEKTDITSKLEQDCISNSQEPLLDSKVCNVLTYADKLEMVYNNLSKSNDLNDELIADLCKAYSGRDEWLWKKRFVKGKRILKKLKRNRLTQGQEEILNNIRNVIRTNKYVRRNHSLIYQDLQRRLDVNNPNFYCSLIYWKDNLLNKLRSKEKRAYNNLEERVQTTASKSTTSLNRSEKSYKGVFGKYLKGIAKYVGIAALATSMILMPVRYCSKNNHDNKKSVVYTIKKGDNLWNVTKDYLKKNGVKLDNKTIYKAVDKIAEDNGKGKQAEYKIGGKEEKNPHHIKPGQKISLSKKILKYLKEGNKR